MSMKEAGEGHKPIQTISEFAAKLGFVPQVFDPPNLKHRSFVKHTDTFVAVLNIDIGQFLEGTRITLRVLPVDVDQSPEKAASARFHARDYVLNGLDDESLSGLLNEYGKFDSKALKHGGYDKVAAVVRDLEASGEIEGASGWLAFRRDFPLLFQPEELSQLVQRIGALEEFRFKTPHESPEVVLDAIHDYDTFAQALGFRAVTCTDPEPKWHCYARDMGGYRLQLLVEQLVHNSGVRMYLRELAPNESDGNLQLGGDNIGTYFYSKISETHAEVIEPFGKFDEQWLLSSGLQEVAMHISDFEQEGMLDGLHKAKAFYARYQHSPVLFREEALGRLSE